MQPPTNAPQAITPYEHQAREAALKWSQLALSTNVPAFDILSTQQRDLHADIVGSHRLSVEHQIRRWCGSVVAGADDILCSTRDDFDEGLKQQGLLALYDESTHEALTDSITDATYAASRQPSYRPVSSQRLRYHEYCEDCHARGTLTCPNCHGAGDTSCSSCAGHGDEPCSSCGGSGQGALGYTDSDGHAHDATHCSGCGGSGHVQCGSCGGGGWEWCGNCHRTGLVSCAACKGTGSFTEIGQIALLHTPEYRVTFDSGSPEASRHVLNCFGHAGFAEHATVHLDSLNRVDDTYTSTTLAFSYRFQLPAVQIKVKTRQTILGTGDHSEWTVVGYTPELIDCDCALLPLLLGASIPLARTTRWRSLLQRGYDRRVSSELNSVLKHGVHQWIVEAASRNSSVEAIEIQVRRALDPLSIAAVANNVTRALKTTYRRRLLLHQAAALLITGLLLWGANDASHQFVRGLLTATPFHDGWLSVMEHIKVAAGNGALWITLASLAALGVSVVISFQYRQRSWLRRAGGDALWARAVSLGHIKLLSPSFQILGAMAIGALLTHAVLTGR